MQYGNNEFHETESIGNKAKKFSPVIFGIILISFFLPFFTVSCQDQKVSTYTGFQLVTGTTVVQPGMFGGKQKVLKVPGIPLVTLILLSAVIGLGLSFFQGRKTTIANIIIGVLGIVLLFLLKTRLDNEILREGGGLLRIEYNFGFWLTFLLFFFSAGLNYYLSFVAYTPMIGKDFIFQREATATIYCTQCGAKNERGGRFCQECGDKLDSLQ